MNLRERKSQQKMDPGSASSYNPRNSYSSSRSIMKEEESEPFNIIPIHYLLADHPCLRFPEVRYAADALRSVSNLRRHPYVPWREDMDILDWIGCYFGFQQDNIRNQREHILLLLANAQMRFPDNMGRVDTLDPTVIRNLRRKLLDNYNSWCSYIGQKSNVIVPPRDKSGQRELLYISLYLLVWGEAANLRFLPECLCYIFHNLAREMNYVLDDYHDIETGSTFLPDFIGENAFLKKIVIPIYNTLKKEAENSRNGTAPHSAWRNYDDFNEYFWSRKSISRLRWPMNQAGHFFSTDRKNIGKTGFVEQRSFWNIFRSFDRLWVMHILFLQAAIIVAWDGSSFPWKSLRSRDVQVQCLTIFITWAGLRFLQSILDAGTQYSLVRRDSFLLCARMVLKILVSIGWIVAFSVLYSRIWHQKNRDRGWSMNANGRILNFLEASFVFVFPEILALILFVLPWLRNWLEMTNWKILYALAWWFQTRIFVGRGIREGIIENTMYGLFWIAILVSKFSFSYLLQIKPMIAPTKAMLNMKVTVYKWHEFFSKTPRFGAVLLWLPVVLVYFMDLQIWYSIFSAFVGGLVGLFSHLGEIRSVEQLRLRFQFFSSAMQFNLLSEEPRIDSEPKFWGKINDVIQMLKLRYGLGRPYRKIESDQVEATKFAMIWNEIIGHFREEDIISDREVELLELTPKAWKISVIRWPCFLLCNELLLALNQANDSEPNVSDKWLQRKICKNEYRRCAVIEAYDSIKYLLHNIIMSHREEHHIVSTLFSEIDENIARNSFTKSYKMSMLKNIHSNLVLLVKLLTEPKKDLEKLVNILQTLYDISIRDFPKVKRSMEELRKDGLAPQKITSDELLFENAINLPDDKNLLFYRQLRRLSTILSSKDSMHNVPVNLEARRRIAFFSNSLFMNIPRAPKVENMLAFSVLTPYYNEDVLFSKEQLRSENEDGISIIFYLQKIYEDEWINFMERMRRNGMVEDGDIWTNKDRIRDLRLWASYRGQTLARTVRGMMYYNKALQILAYLDNASEMDIKKGSKMLESYNSSGLGNGINMDLNSIATRSSRNTTPSTGCGGVSLLFKGAENGAAMMKYTYVVACQIYGAQKEKKDPRADDILYLMKNNEALRVAYVDEVKTGRNEAEYYSVLVKYDQKLQKEVEIYRIRLPGSLKLGEGKPENQNHAIIFTRGDAVQTIDMNQDNYFEEALKMRNLLEEYTAYYGIRKPTILGVREHIFTGSVSSLAWFMCAQETSFVTLGQRVLANPLKVRMHYGHPDVFDRLWFLSRGGISKASKVINISEDIFAGFNCTLRGGNVTHHEYIQVGKGRDVGLNQISMFEAKVASGNGEQVLSRDVYRLGHRLDFFRMLSFYYTTVGFFFNTMMVILTFYAFAWGRLYLTLSGLEDSIVRSVNNSSNNKALGVVLNQQFVVQLGLFTALPMIVENSLEHGFVSSIWDFLTMQLQLASVFYTFSMGTRSHFFGRTVLHGGAKYRATGRGFVVQHKGFVDIYRLYARSHFVKAIELGVILVVYASYSPMAKKTFFYIVMSLSSWLLVISWMLGPFIFNPSGFDWLKTVYDFENFMDWIWCSGDVFTKAEESWETWWYEEQDHLRTTGLWGKLLEIILNIRYFFFQYAIVYQLGIANNSTNIGVYLLSWIYVLIAIGIYMILRHARYKYGALEHIYYRAVGTLIICLVVLLVVFLLRFTNLKFIDLLTSLMAYIPTGWGMISIAQVIRPFLRFTVVWDVIVSVARFYDILFGVIVMIPVALLSWLPGFQSMQTRILFNEGFSRGLQISQILTGKKSHVDG